VEVYGSGRVRDGHGRRDEAAASRHLRAEGCRGGQRAVPNLVLLGASDTGANQRTARADGPSYTDDRRALGGNLDPLDSIADDRLNRGSQQFVLGREAQIPRVPDGGIRDGYALLRCRETYPTVLLTH